MKQNEIIFFFTKLTIDPFLHKNWNWWLKLFNFVFIVFFYFQKKLRPNPKEPKIKNRNPENYKSKLANFNDWAKLHLFSEKTRAKTTKTHSSFPLVSRKKIELLFHDLFTSIVRANENKSPRWELNMQICFAFLFVGQCCASEISHNRHTLIESNRTEPYELWTFQ